MLHEKALTNAEPVFGHKKTRGKVLSCVTLYTECTSEKRIRLRKTKIIGVNEGLH